MNNKHDYDDKTTPVRFLRDTNGRTYNRMADGSIRRISPSRPWRGKSERRAAIKARRAARLAARPHAS